MRAKKFSEMHANNERRHWN